MAIIGNVFGLTAIYERQVENIANDNFESWPESATYGYFGGSTPVDRIDFSNDTVSAPGNNLTEARDYLGVVSNSNYGYFGGGFAPSAPGRVCTIDRLDFSNETLSSPGNNLSKERQGVVATQSNSYGYFAGGLAPPYVCTIDRLDIKSLEANICICYSENQFKCISCFWATTSEYIQMSVL